MNDEHHFCIIIFISSVNGVNGELKLRSQKHKLIPYTYSLINYVVVVSDSYRLREYVVMRKGLRNWFSRNRLPKAVPRGVTRTERARQTPVFI